MIREGSWTVSPMLLHMTRCATGSMLAPLKNVPAMPKRYLTLFELIVHVSNWFDFITIRHFSCSVDRCLHDVVSERSGGGFEHAACRRSRGHVRTSPNNTRPCYQELGASSSTSFFFWITFRSSCLLSCCKTLVTRMLCSWRSL